MQIPDRNSAIEEINRTIGIRLSAMRQSQQLTPSDLATRMRTSAAMITRFERASSAMSAAELVLAAKVLGTNASVLTGEATFKEPSNG
jgi:transcriptional regulator with XRE-family HTH domain